MCSFTNLSSPRSYIPYTPESEAITSCGIPQNYAASKEWADKKVVLFSVPGAFTPGCSVRHLPGYIEKLAEIKGKNVDIVAVLAYNDAFVMSAWSKANGIKNDEIVRVPKISAPKAGLETTCFQTLYGCSYEHYAEWPASHSHVETQRRKC